MAAADKAPGRGPAGEGLRDVQWETHYETGYQDLVDDFYVPALSRAVCYDRKAGFFSSDALAIAAAGVARLLKRGGRMRLLVGVRLSKDDAEAIYKGYRRREEIIAESLRRDWVPTEDEIKRQRLEVLAEMVARGLLEIRVVAAVDEDGRPLSAAEAEGMFHQKAGIFTDAAGDKVAFVGSINETAAGWQRNVEELQVFCSWRADARHVEDQVRKFEALWNGEHPRAQTFNFPEALRQKLLELRPKELLDRDPLERAAIEQREAKLERERWLFQFVRDAPLLENGWVLVEEFAAVKPLPHQRLIYRKVADQYPQRWFMLCDEVGLGKTIEAGFILRSLMLSERVRRVLILAPKHIIKQWQEELREKFNLWAYWYNGKEFQGPLGEKYPAPAENPWDADFPLIIASAHLARRRGRMERLLEAREWDLVVVDEAHHARRRWAPGGQRRPNRMLRLLERLKQRTKSMLLITATPMQIDVRELWDLLRLMGMKGRWAENWGEDFRRYFDILRRPDSEWSSEDLRFLCEMVNEYFAAGGSADEALARRFREVRGGFILWQQLTGRGGAEPAVVREAMKRNELRPLLREFFRRHTPVRQFMFRFTRRAMRAYRKQGLISMTIPERDVEDVFIDLGEARRLYERIEEYISEHYRKAEAERRHALGYVLTIYRQRLTSSPWAIYRTLERHKQALEKQEALLDRLSEEFEEEDPDVLAEIEDLGEVLDPEQLEEEIAALENLLAELRGISKDPKLSRLLRDVETLRGEHPRLIIFTQYTDTMDFLRDALLEVYGPEVACYSGRGGELWDSGSQAWRPAKKEEVKEGFIDGRFPILVCTEAASEGLNLQASNLLINYDMPWNPMRVDQRIGRIDRIGQQKPRVYVRNYYYQDTVEADIYAVLTDRLQVFRTAVGPHQPVLGRVPKLIERLAMTVPAEREAVRAEIERELDEAIARTERSGIDIDELGENVLIQEPVERTPISPEELRDLFTRSPILSKFAEWKEVEAGVYSLKLRHEPQGAKISLPAHNPDAAIAHTGTTLVTFRQEILEARPTYIHHCVAWGAPVFKLLLSLVAMPESEQTHKIRRIRTNEGKIRYLDRTTNEDVRTFRGLRERL